jgi:hypothetical protein
VAREDDAAVYCVFAWIRRECKRQQRKGKQRKAKESKGKERKTAKSI